MWWFRLVIFRFLLCVCPFFLLLRLFWAQTSQRTSAWILRFHVQLEKDRCRAIHTWHNVTLDCGDFMCPPKGSKTECIAGESWWFQRNLGWFTSTLDSNRSYDMLKTFKDRFMFWGASHTICFPDPVCYSAFVEISVYIHGICVLHLYIISAFSPLYDIAWNSHDMARWITKNYMTVYTIHGAYRVSRSGLDFRTSITIPDIICVVDSGLARVKKHTNLEASLNWMRFEIWCRNFSSSPSLKSAS